MSRHKPQSSIDVIRWALGLGLLAASACASAQVVDLVIHNGFEACWSKAITKAQFLGLLQTTLDGASACVSETIGSASGFNYDACNTAACPNNQIGCPVTIHAGAFNGDFGTGAFSGPGSADDITVPITYSYGLASGSCDVTITNIALTYQPSFYVQPDGNSGDYMAYLTQSSVMIDSYNASSLDLLCDSLVGLFQSSLVTQAEAAASAELAAALDGTAVGETVCPLTP